MSNRLGFAHVAFHREPHELLAGPAPSRGLAARALHWVNGLADGTDSMSPAMQRDLGLPETRAAAMSLAYEIERSRVRV